MFKLYKTYISKNANDCVKKTFFLLKVHFYILINMIDVTFDTFMKTLSILHIIDK
mgnify:FL=1